MKFKSIIKILAACGAFAMSLNYFSLPGGTYIHSNSLKNNIRDKQIQKVCKTDSYLEQIKADNVLELVKVAHAISAKHLSYDCRIPIPFYEKEKALEGKADCSYFSGFTYSNFLYLADKLGKPEFKDKVKLCSGDWGSSVHAWLQVYFNNKWNNYEATYDRLKQKDKINFKNIHLQIPSWMILNHKNYHTFSFLHFENNELVNHTNIFKSFGSGADLKDLIIKYFS